MLAKIYEKLLDNAAIVLILLVVAVIGIYPAISYSTVDHTVIMVEEKERANTKGGGYYLVFTEAKGVMEISDSLWFWRWDSSDLYGELKAGEFYYVKTEWFRFGLFSMYPNILEARHLPEPEINKGMRNITPRSKAPNGETYDEYHEN